MNYSIATVLLLTATNAVSFVDAAIVKDSVRGLKSDKKTKNFTGDCSVLSFTEYIVDTSWTVDQSIVYSYPCSGGYAKNFASNENLLEDVRNQVNEAGRALGINADCANLCDFDNKSYELVGDNTPNEAITGRVSIIDVYPPEIGAIFCDPVDGILNNFNPFRDDAFNNGPNADQNACRCDPDNNYISGCYECQGSVKFAVKSCLDSSSFKTTKAGKRGR